MSDAERARTEGSRAIERETYRSAAQAYPTSKAPWLKLAEAYFEVHDYGNAILAAQEVLQRDPADKVASSLLAVSGLRVSASALSSMRQRESLGADTRQQAEDLVKTLREALGEPLLVPAEPPPPRPARRAVRRAVAPAPAAAAPAPAPSKPAANPFQSLIK